MTVKNNITGNILSSNNKVTTTQWKKKSNKYKQQREDAPPPIDPVITGEVPNEKWSSAQLKEYANNHDIDYSDAKNKAQLLALILEEIED